jgi:hypothetical protein
LKLKFPLKHDISVPSSFISACPQVFSSGSTCTPSCLTQCQTEKKSFRQLCVIFTKNSMVHDLAWRKCSSFSLYPQMKRVRGVHSPDPPPTFNSGTALIIWQLFWMIYCVIKQIYYIWSSSLKKNTHLETKISPQTWYICSKFIHISMPTLRNIYKKQHGARPCVEKMQFIFFVPSNEES